GSHLVIRSPTVEPSARPSKVEFTAWYTESVVPPEGEDRVLQGRTALCLCPGGITGAMYEGGVLAALDEVFVDFSAAHFAVYVGTSAGAFVAWAVASGIAPERLFQAVLDPQDEFLELSRTDIYRFNPRQILGVARDLVSITGTYLFESLHRGRFSLSEYLK